MSTINAASKMPTHFHEQIEALQADMKTLMTERDEFFAMQKDFIASQEEVNTKQVAADAARQAKGWAIDRALETIKVCAVDCAPEDVLKLADTFTAYILEVA